MASEFMFSQMRQRRKCLYRNCGHNQGNNVHHCTFHTFPKDPLISRRWLHLSGVCDKTPKKLVPNWCICSCHFPAGKSKENCFPEEFIEDTDDVMESNLLSPPHKARRVAVDSLTPSTKAAVEALISLPTATLTEASIVSNMPSQLRRKTPTYSPRRKLWRTINNAVWQDKRKAFHQLMDLSDLGVEALPEENFEPSYVENESLQTSTSYLQFDLSHEIKQDENLDSSLIQSDIIGLPSNDIVVSLSVENPEVEIIQENNLGTKMTQSDDFEVPFIGTDFCVPPIDNNNNCMKLLDDLSLSSEGVLNKTSVARRIDTSFVSSTPLPPIVQKKLHDCDCELEGRHMRSIGVQCSRAYLCYEKCKLRPEDDFKFYTGVTQEMFEILYKFLGGDEICCKLKYKYEVKTPTRRQFQGDLSSKDKLFLTLLRLRRGIPLRDLSVLFSISEGYASKVAYTWIRFMSLQFQKLEDAMFVPTSAQQSQKPRRFEMFENLRVIIDATEFKIEKPKNLQQNSNTYSDYKNYNSAKFLIGISCFGGLSFIREGYEGSISDRKLVLKSGFLDHLEPRDGVMADRGFDMEDIADERDFDLYIPAFLQRRSAFTGRELILSRAIAESRIHVERFISRIKEFRLVRYVIPNSTLAVASDMVKVCAFLVNFQDPFIKFGDKDE